jgi:hypothetical protein
MRLVYLLVLVCAVSGGDPLDQHIQPRALIGPIPRACVHRLDPNDAVIEVLQLVSESGAIHKDPASSSSRIIRDIRRYLYIDQPSLFALIVLNKKNEPIDEDTFLNFLESLKGGSSRSTRCRLHIWYFYAVNPLVGSGKTFRDIGLIPEIKLGRVSYQPPPAVLQAMVQLKLSRIDATRKRKTEDDSDVAEFLEGIFPPEDVFGDIVLSESGRIESPPTLCTKPREFTCAAEFRGALHRIRELGYFPPVPQIIHELDYQPPHPEYKCIHSSLRTFRAGIVLPEPTVSYLIELNQIGREITRREFRDLYRQEKSISATRCGLHVWFHTVINPNAGKPVREIGLLQMGSGSPDVLYHPSSVDLIRLIDLELARI